MDSKIKQNILKYLTSRQELNKAGINEIEKIPALTDLKKSIPSISLDGKNDGP